MKKILLAVAAAALMAIGAQAGETEEISEYSFTGMEHYVGITANINQTSERLSDIDFGGYGGNEFTNAGFGIVAGKKLMQRDHIDVFVEGRIQKSFLMDEGENIGTSSYALYLKPQFTVFKHINLYGLLGVNMMKFEERNHKVTITKSSPAAGVGIQMNARSNLAFILDAIWSGTDAQLNIFQEPVTHATLNVGVLYRF